MFRGTRKAFLKGELVVYAAAVEGGFVANGVALIARHYFKRYPVSYLLTRSLLLSISPLLTTKPSTQTSRLWTTQSCLLKSSYNKAYHEKNEWR